MTAFNFPHPCNCCGYGQVKKNDSGRLQNRRSNQIKNIGQVAAAVDCFALVLESTKLNLGWCRKLTGWTKLPQMAAYSSRMYVIGPELCEPDTAGKKMLCYFVPSRSILASGLISCGFKVNCEDERYGNPTHSLVFESGSLYLKPLRKAEVGMEFTYDYRYYLGVRTSIDT